MSNLAQMLMEKRRGLEEQARALLDRAESENRGLTAEENATFDRITADMQSLRSQADKIAELETSTRGMEDGLRKIGHKGPSDRADLTTQFRQLANREIGKLEFKPTSAESRTLTEHRALSKGTATAGGNTVPTFMGRFYEHLIESATLVNAGATVFNTDSGANFDVPVTTTHGTAALVPESGTIPQSDPAFAKRTLGAFKYGILIYVPTELLADTGVDLEGYLARMSGRAVGNAFGAHLISGTGTGQPTGIVTSASLGVTGGTGVAGVPTLDNLVDLMHSVIAPYRNSPEAGWLVKDSTVGYLRKLKDTTNRYLWEPSLVPGQPDMLLGHPVYTDPNIAATGVNAKSVLFGDLSTYWVRLVNNVRFERSDEFKFDTDVVSFRCLLRGDGLLVDQSGAVKYFVGAAT